MRRSKYFIASAIIIINCIPALYAQSWKNIADRPYGSGGRGISFSMKNKGYVGLEGGPMYTKSISCYDPVKNEWKDIAVFPGKARISAVAFVVDDNAYVGCGDMYDKNATDFWKYNPVSDVWKEVKNFPGIGRRYAVGFSIGSKGYIGVGCGVEQYGNDVWDFDKTVSYYDDFWEYDPAKDRWTERTKFPGGGRNRAIGFSIGNKGYVGLGYGKDGAKKDLWEYDAVANKWSKKSTFPGKTPIASVCFTIGKKVYIGTGLETAESATAINEFWEYDSEKNSWKQIANYPGMGVCYASAFSIGNKGYVGMGCVRYDRPNAGGCFNDFWVYEPGLRPAKNSKSIPDLFVMQGDKKKDTINQYFAKQQSTIEAYNNRTIAYAKEINIHSDSIMLSLWDHGQVDGDTVSLYINDQIIVSNLAINKSNYTVKANLKRGKNYLVLYAHNLGSVAPNTCAISINDNLHFQTIVLNSDFNTSEGIIINYNQ